MSVNNKLKYFFIITALLSLLLAGCTPTADKSAAGDTSWQYPRIADAEFVKAHVKVPAPKGSMIIDSRPKRAKYDKGHIPTAVSIPFSKFDKLTDRLPKNKDDLLIFYCGGFKCKLSHKSAYKAEKMGYKNIRVYAAGFPDWMKVPGHYASVSVDYMKKQVANGADMMIVDSRPKRPKYDKGHLPKAISIPDSKFNKLTSRLPAEKKKLLVFYCGGHKCKLSHKSAKKAIELGYTNVKVFAAGYPAWKKAEASAAAAKTGPSEGSIDLAYFKRLLAKDPQSMMLIDVRDSDEYAAGRFQTAINIPTDQLETQIPTLPTTMPVVFVCSTGARSGEAFYMVQDLRPEMKNVFYLEAEVAYHAGNKFTITPTE